MKHLGRRVGFVSHFIAATSALNGPDYDNGTFCIALVFLSAAVVP